MSDFKRARQLHKLLDEVEEGRVLDCSDMQQLRAALPELPKQKTLEELCQEVYDVWIGASGNEWPDDVYGDLETWLDELHAQLQGLKNTPSPVPSLPEGMRLADHKVRGRCVVSPKTDEDGDFLAFTTDKGCETGAHYLWLHPEHLAFIDPEPGHPEFLETEADYASAPNGTIVAADKISTAWIKTPEAWHSTDGDRSVEYPILSVGTRRVLRWGWGE